MRQGRVSPAAVVGWAGLAVLLVGAFLAALGALNQTIYGASSFVERYLEAIADDDIAAASTTPGVALDAAELAATGLPENVSTAMFRSGVVKAGPEDVRIVSDVANADGIALGHRELPPRRVDHRDDLRRAARSSRSTACSTGGSSPTSPLAVIDVTAAHNPLFTVGTLTLDTRATKTGDELAAFTQIAPYLAIAPAVYEFGYTSTLLEAVPDPDGDRAGVPARRSRSTPCPPTTFVERVQVKVDDYLQQCTAQQVLQPAGCPFGIEIDDRVVSPPVWTMVTSPRRDPRPGRDGVRDAADRGRRAHLGGAAVALRRRLLHARGGPAVPARAQRVDPSRRQHRDPAEVTPVVRRPS